MCVNNLPRTAQRGGQDSTWQPVYKSSIITTRPPSHTSRDWPSKTVADRFTFRHWRSSNSSNMVNCISFIFISAGIPQDFSISQHLYPPCGNPTASVSIPREFHKLGFHSRRICKIYVTPVLRIVSYLVFIGSFSTNRRYRATEVGNIACRGDNTDTS